MSQVHQKNPVFEALESLCRLGVCTRADKLVEDDDLEYSFKIEPDNHFNNKDLENLRKIFNADQIDISFWYEQDNNNLNVTLRYNHVSKELLED